MSDGTLRDAVRKLAGTFNNDEVYILACSVNTVDEKARTCDCRTIEGKGIIDIPNVQLMADVDDGLLMLPTVGSTVIVMYSKRSRPFVVMYSQVDKILMISGSSVISVKDGAIQFNDGSYGGLIQIKQLISKINTLENDLNTIKKAVSTWTPVPNDGGAALKAASATWAATTLIKTQQSDIENTTIQHGK